MRRLRLSGAGLTPASGALLLAAAIGSPAVAAPAPLSFDQVFETRGEPAAMHYEAQYQARGGPHHLEVWRDGGRRLKRVTDKALVSYVERAPGAGGYRLSIVDPRKRTVTRIDRTDMYRLGGFVDWFDLAHGLRRPKGAYRLAEGQAGVRAPTGLAPCRWWDLTQGARTVRICWSGDTRLPLLIVSEGQVVWRVTSLDRHAIPARTFRVAAKGYVTVDADSDIGND